MATVEKNDVFETLSAVDVTGHIEEKDTGRVKLKYLSWAWAWYEVRKRYPNATYTIIKNENGLPYFVDPQLGIMVYTSVTIGEEEHTMWLPVMDGANNPMRLEPYDIPTNYGKKHVNAATMFDINKTIMRCLTKNLGMFGIGLALYAGEDLFDDTDGNKGVEATLKTKPATKPVANTAANAQAEASYDVSALIKELDARVQAMVKTMTAEQKDALAAKIKEKLGIVDYRKCKDGAALTELLTSIKAA